MAVLRPITKGRQVLNMRIRRRLSISNIIMAVIPIFLLILFFCVMGFVVIRFFGNWGGPPFGDTAFSEVKKEIDALVQTWNGDEDALYFGLQNVQERFKQGHVTVFLFKDGLLAMPENEASIVAPALGHATNDGLVLSNTALYVQKVAGYDIVLADTNYLNYQAEYLPYFIIIIVLLLLIIAIIFAANRILTRKMIKSIMTPIDTLSYGVNQVRDGNLQFRLTYIGNDEFSAVCTAFNEMAERLQNAVDDRKKDEESRKELIAGISHDLRTPLSSIKVCIEGLESGVASTPTQQKKYMDIVKAKTEDLEHIISQLFLFSKLDVGEFPMDMRPVDIGCVITGFAEEFAAEYRNRGFDIRMLQVPQGVIVNTDTTWLHNIFANIIENSVKYGQRAQGEVVISCLVFDSDVEIRVADNGPGVPDDMLGKLFEIFYRADPARNTKGSGLGLAITAKILGIMGGRVAARNQPGGGLAIIMRLPIAKEGTEGI